MLHSFGSSSPQPHSARAIWSLGPVNHRFLPLCNFSPCLGSVLTLIFNSGLCSALPTALVLCSTRSFLSMTLSSLVPLHHSLESMPETFRLRMTTAWTSARASGLTLSILLIHTKLCTDVPCVLFVLLRIHFFSITYLLSHKITSQLLLNDMRSLTISHKTAFGPFHQLQHLWELPEVTELSRAQTHFPDV